MKSILAAGIIFGAGSAAYAGPYLNVEANQGFQGGVSSDVVTDAHFGLEGEYGQASWYVQGGPSFTSGKSAAQATGKAGGSMGVSEKLSVYLEGSFGTVEDGDTAYGAKVGTKLKF
jgi:hypothetical protein